MEEVRREKDGERGHRGGERGGEMRMRVQGRLL